MNIVCYREGKIYRWYLKVMVEEIYGEDWLSLYNLRDYK